MNEMLTDDAVIWIAVIAAGLLSFAVKYLGHVVPESWLAHPRVARIVNSATIALLGGLIAIQVFTSGQALALDARAAGLAAAVILLLVRAPFIVVVIGAAAVAAGLRALGWG